LIVQNVENAMTLLLAVLALGSLLAAFWFVGAHVGTDPTHGSAAGSLIA
jgi:hypothetical protein